MIFVLIIILFLFYKNYKNNNTSDSLNCKDKLICNSTLMTICENNGYKRWLFVDVKEKTVFCVDAKSDIIARDYGGDSKFVSLDNGSLEILRKAGANI